PTIYSAIDLAVEKIETQIKKHKSKIYSSLKKREGLSSHFTTSTDFDLEKMKTEVKAINLVKSKSVDLEAITPEEAITQMEMLGHDFFVFLNVETNKVCIVYLREDMDYGIIEANM
ncbi:MAG: HPF/RaiA family ribosome-associated protein, partial [Bacilli bacterium]|nr:HPF/RaiA family ribosome-associated protein [Bacilli bacterium]